MSEAVERVNPLHQRMINDMQIRKLCDKTQTQYLRAVRRLVAYLNRPPDTATDEDLRDFQLHMVKTGISGQTINATI